MSTTFNPEGQHWQAGHHLVSGSSSPFLHHRDDADLELLRTTYGIYNPRPSTNIPVEYDFHPTRTDELAVKRGEIVCVLHSFKDHWSLCKNEVGLLGMVPSDRLCLMDTDIDMPMQPKCPVEGGPRSPSTLPRITSVELRPRSVGSTGKASTSRGSVLALLEFLQSTKRRRAVDTERVRFKGRLGPLSVLRGASSSRSKQTISKLSRRVRFFPLREEIEIPAKPEDIDSDSDESFCCSSESSRADTPSSQYSQDSSRSITPPTDIEPEACDAEEPITSPNTTAGDKLEDVADCISSVASPIVMVEPEVPVENDTPRRIVYRNVLSLLIGQLLPSDILWATLQEYLSSLKSLDLVSSLVQSHDYRVKLLKVAASLGISGDPRIRKALQEDEDEIAEILHLISLSAVLRRAVLALEGDDAQKFLDAVQDVLDKGYLLNNEDGVRARQLLVRLSETCDKLPSSLFIKGVTRPDREEHAVYAGGFGDVFRATYQDQVVALKKMRIFKRDSGIPAMRRRFCREALVWQQLNSNFIVPFLGIDAETFPAGLCMVSPWMRHGTVLKHLAEHGRTDVDKRLHEIAQGLAYLHSQNIIHGDLRGANILVNDKWQACLTDFGLAVIDGMSTATFTSRREGSARWMAPELHAPELFGLDRFRLTTKTDVYAFGCVCLELYTGVCPFVKLKHDTAVMLRVINGERPKRPLGRGKMSDQLWNVVERCWNHDFADRPDTKEVVDRIGLIAECDKKPEVVDITVIEDSTNATDHCPEPKISQEKSSAHHLPRPLSSSPVRASQYTSPHHELKEHNLPDHSGKIHPSLPSAPSNVVDKRQSYSSSILTPRPNSLGDLIGNAELSSVWSDCLKLYKDACGEDKGLQDEDDHLKSEDPVEDDWALRLLRLLHIREGVAHIERELGLLEPAETSDNEMEPDQPPRSPAREVHSPACSVDRLPVALQEKASDCWDFEHELDVAFGKDFALGDLQLVSDHMKESRTSAYDAMEPPAEQYQVPFVYGFSLILSLAIAIYVTISSVSSGGPAV